MGPRKVEMLPLVESPLPCMADLSLRVLEDCPHPFELPADVGTLRMESPPAHLSQFATDLSESQLDVAQPAVDSPGPPKVPPALLGLVGCLTSQDPNLPCRIVTRHPPQTISMDLRISEVSDIRRHWRERHDGDAPGGTALGVSPANPPRPSLGSGRSLILSG